MRRDQLDYTNAPTVYEKSLNEDYWRYGWNEDCFYCGALTAYGEWIREQPQEWQDWNEGRSTTVSEAVKARADREYQEVEKRALYTLVAIDQRHQRNRAKDANGQPIFIDRDITTRRYAQVCKACFAMEPALAEALDEGWRFCRIDLRARCERCGRTKPAVLHYCVTCQREYRMLESQMLAARQNRRLINRLNEAIRHGQD